MASTYRFQAVNQAKTSQNKIHDDEIARTYGFSGGLVPGVTVFTYMADPVVANLGRQWLESGRISARFFKPIYDGESVTVELEQGEGSQIVIGLRNSSDEICAEGQASLEHAEPPDISEFPPAPLREEVPVASEVTWSQIGTLGTYEATFRSERANSYFDSIRVPAFKERFAHPG